MNLELKVEQLDPIVFLASISDKLFHVVLFPLAARVSEALLF